MIDATQTTHNLIVYHSTCLNTGRGIRDVIHLDTQRLAHGSHPSLLLTDSGGAIVIQMKGLGESVDCNAN